MKRRVLAAVLALAMVVTGLYVTEPTTKEVKAAEATTNTDMLGIKLQTRRNSDDTTDVRIVSSVDGLNYEAVGFQVWYGEAASEPTDANVTTTFTTTTVLERIEAGVSYNFSPQIIDPSSKYFVTGTIKGINPAKLGENFYIRTFCIPTGGTEADLVYGVGRFFNVEDATAAGTINIPLAMDADPGATLNNITVAGKATQATVEAYLDGYAHLNVAVPSDYADKTELPSASIVAVGDEKTIHRNLVSPLKVTENGGSVTVTGDDTWLTKYLELNPNEKEFVIANAADLYGLASYTQTHGMNGKKVYLIADIDLNDGKGTATESGFVRSDGKTPYPWRPIGNFDVAKFDGTFDGNMHTISGLYANTTSRYQALFEAAYGATITNLRLENSYIESSNQWVASILGRGYGNLSNIYSNAILKCGAAYQGGIIAQTDLGGSTMTNCWFDGKVINTYSAGANSRGFVGGLIGYSAQNDVIQDCLITGSIDVSQLKVATRPGTGGLVGVNANALQVDRSVMLASVKAPGSGCANPALYYAYVGSNQGTFTGSGSYSVHSAPSSEYNAWSGNYSNFDGGSATFTFRQPFGSLANVRGLGARVNMPNLDWVNNWRAMDGKIPVPKVFATDYVDTDWYDVTKQDGENYKITTRQDLYGLTALVNAGVTFEGQTIELTNDIVVNETDVLDWENTTPQYNWETIGSLDIGKSFKGTLDGKGNTISGLYLNTTNQYCAMFGSAVGATIKNLKLTNSYFATTNQWAASFIARGNGTFENVYSDATVKCARAFVGGFLAQLDGASTSLTKCWFDGEIISTSSGNSAGFVGAFIGYVTTPASFTDCLNTGHMDITATANTKAGAGGLFGVMDAINQVITINDCAMLGSISANGQSGFYAIVGDLRNGTISGADNYVKVDRHSTAHTHFEGAYPGATIAGFGVARVTYAGVHGDAAMTAMPGLNWTITWQTTNGLPVLKDVK